MKKNEIKIVLTGGHAGTTALATIEEIKKRSLQWDLYWIGVKHAIEGKQSETLEYKIFPSLGVHYVSLLTGRVQRKLTAHTIPSLLRIPFGVLQSFIYIAKLHPKLIVSFGGYASFPVVLAGYFLRVPVIVHEQTASAGLANKISSYFATKIALARESSLKYYQREKSVVVGNPILDSVLKVRAKAKLPKVPTIFIVGGSRGSQIINENVKDALPSLLENFSVEHLTGDIDIDKFLEFKKSLPQDLRDRYKLKAFSSNIGEYYANADIMISRAGANTVAEIMAIGIPSVLIPIPWSRYDEQTKNAKLAEKRGVSIILAQDSLTPKSLLDAVYKVRKNWGKMTKTNEDSIDLKADENFTTLLESTVNST